jgi:hypothetical protein
LKRNIFIKQRVILWKVRKLIKKLTFAADKGQAFLTKSSYKEKAFRNITILFPKRTTRSPPRGTMHSPFFILKSRRRGTNQCPRRQTQNGTNKRFNVWKSNSQREGNLRYMIENTSSMKNKPISINPLLDDDHQTKESATHYE